MLKLNKIIIKDSNGSAIASITDDSIVVATGYQIELEHSEHDISTDKLIHDINIKLNECH